MASRLLRRSGVAVCLIAELLEWEADVVYQVGVGGYHEEVKVMQEAWPKVRFYGLEPHPLLFRDLKRKYPGILMQVAASDSSCFRSLHSKKNHVDGSSLHDLGDQKVNTFAVKALPIDEIWEPPQSKALLWIDCEGHEIQALQGATKFLTQVDVVNVEMTANPPGKGWSHPVDVHRLLTSAGFYRQWMHTQRSSAGQCDGIYVRPSLFHPELCCCPCEQERFSCEKIASPTL